LIDGTAFRPAWWLPGAHLQTIVPTLSTAPWLPGPTERRVVRVSTGSAVRLDVDRPRGPARGPLLLVHGLGGSSESVYVRLAARHALERGFVTARMNLRNCGGTEHLADTLYNAGQSGDVGHAVADLSSAGLPRPIVVVGFSLGGNLALLHAGREGAACVADAVVGINPPIALEACVDAIERPRNRIYQAYYVLKLRRQLASIAAVRPLGCPVPSLRSIGSVRCFDERFTAPDGGFASAHEYYERSSAAPVIGGIRRPALVISAADDPFVPCSIFDGHRSVAGLRLVHPARGGHCGYWQSGTPRSWAARVVVDFAESIAAGQACGRQA
jgi:predicted alpha/beta-fold hydrolase